MGQGAVLSLDDARRMRVCRYCGCPIDQATRVEQWWDDVADDADHHISTHNGQEYAHTECVNAVHSN